MSLIGLQFLPIRRVCKIPSLPDDLTSKSLRKYYTMSADTRKTKNEKARGILYLAKRNGSKENDTKLSHSPAASNSCEQKMVRNER